MAIKCKNCGHSIKIFYEHSKTIGINEKICNCWKKHGTMFYSCDCKNPLPVGKNDKK